MSVYNAGDFLRVSVLSILAQSYSNLELIIIDDGCSDGCMATISDIDDPRIIRLVQSNQGKAVALNYALTIAKGEFLAIQDADDVSYKRRIEMQVDCLLENPDVAAVFTGTDLLVGGTRLAPYSPARTREECAAMVQMMKTPALDPTGVYRRTLVGDVRFDPEFWIGQVYDLILRVGETHPMLVLGMPLYSYRFHWGSITKRSPQVRRDCIKEVFRRAAERRGTTGAANAPTKGGTRVNSSNRVLDNNLAALYIESVLYSRARAEQFKAIRTGWQCSTLHVFDLHYWKALLYGLMPLFLLKAWHPHRLAIQDSFHAKSRNGAA